MTVKWSILMPTLPARRVIRKRMVSEIEKQLANYNDIEFLVLEDNRMREYGPKMQAMIDIAQGEYVSFVDDDDEVSPDYVSTLRSLMTGVDCIGFTGNISIEGGPWENVYYSMGHNVWRNEPVGLGRFDYYRNPQHLTPIRTDLVRQIEWRGHYGADRDWSTRMAESGLLTTENVTPKILYYYHSSQSQNREGVWI